MIKIESKTLENSLSYTAFREFVTNALQNDKAALNIKDDYIAYAELNEARLHRLDKTLKVSEEATASLMNLTKKYTWVVISESWCGDAAQSVPMINKMSEVTDKVELKIVFRDQNLELMDQFLTNGGRSIPKLIIVDAESMQVLGDWGPRPAGATKLVADYKETNGSFDQTGAVELQKWYTKNKGQEVQNEIIELLLSLDK